jgi:carbon catabolite-derepressing protein kinase
MEQRDTERLARAAKREESASSNADGEAEARDADEPTPEEQAATARALKPHARSIVDLEKLRFEPPESFHSAPSQPKKSRKWQFGIRSRNQPYEAMLCLYKAIAAQGGVWEIEAAEPGSSDISTPFFFFFLSL